MLRVHLYQHSRGGEDEREINSSPLLSVCSSILQTRTHVTHKREISKIPDIERANQKKKKKKKLTLIPNCPLGSFKGYER